MSRKDDWFRIPAVSEKEREYFELKLSRSRSGRDQYIDIQAQALAAIDLHKDALDLFDRLIIENPNYFKLAAVYSSKAQSLIALDHQSEAIKAFRKAIRQTLDYPNVRCGTEIKFGLWVIEAKIEHLYGEVRDIVIELYDPAPIFPIDGFLQEAILAITQSRLGNVKDAEDHARIALDWSNREQSNAAKHRNLGLVKEEHDPLRKQLEVILNNVDSEAIKTDQITRIGKVKKWIRR
ncbi:MAG: hypothetical protein Pars92KO_10960 [Parasphingorhabdus sp.]